MLGIDNTTAYFNDIATTLEVAPTIINERTMLPIRYIAECFNFGIAWENDTCEITVIRNSFDDNEYQTITSMTPEYNGQPYIQINDNKPFFKDYELIGSSFEFYSNLDEFGRCDVAMASIGTDLMPTEKRESISSVTPTGWINNYYDNIDGGYIYNRCHLIGFQLTGENANERNLITGTRYLNINGMLPFENLIDDYIEDTENNVMYRVTPIFNGNNLVADGVLLEAFSVEDNGDGISFCVFCYNVQPGINIDYKTGANNMMSESKNTPINSFQSESRTSIGIVYKTPTGKKYHLDAECGGKNSYKTTIKEATEIGLTPCSKCAK